MKLSIRARLSLSFGAIFMALLVLFSAVVLRVMSSNLERELREATSHDMAQIVNEFQEYPFPRALEEMAEESGEFQVQIQIVDEKGHVIHRSSGVKTWEWSTHQALIDKARAKPTWSTTHIGGVSHLVLSQALNVQGQPPLVIQIAKPRAEVNRIRSRLIYALNIGSILILAIALFMGGFFSKKALEPVEFIRQRAESIKSDNLRERLSYDGPPDELHRLTETLNDLLGRISMSFDQMKTFIADASHELRIPITGLRGMLEVALRKDRTKEEYRQVVEDAFHESERISELVWGLLSLARADAGEMKLEKRNVPVQEFLRHVLEESRSLNVEGKISLVLGSVPDVVVPFDEMKIHQVLFNLIENAIRYGKPGGEARLSAEATARDLIITVADNGIGISPEDQDRIFNRFFRVDKARSRELGGTGLGLSIARAIAQAHRGTLTVKSRLGEGSQFVLSLPRS